MMGYFHFMIKKTHGALELFSSKRAFNLTGLPEKWLCYFDQQYITPQKTAPLKKIYIDVLMRYVQDKDVREAIYRHALVAIGLQKADARPKAPLWASDAHFLYWASRYWLKRQTIAFPVAEEHDMPWSRTFSQQQILHKQQCVSQSDPIFSAEYAVEHLLEVIEFHLPLILEAQWISDDVVSVKINGEILLIEFTLLGHMLENNNPHYRQIPLAQFDFTGRKVSLRALRQLASIIGEGITRVFKYHDFFEDSVLQSGTLSVLLENIITRESFLATITARNPLSRLQIDILQSGISDDNMTRIAAERPLIEACIGANVENCLDPQFYTEQSALEIGFQQVYILHCPQLLSRQYDMFLATQIEEEFF
jgi:hypothetical protein